MATPKDNKARYLLFETAKEPLAFDINDIIELATPTYIHRLPHKANSCILGIANINGDICIILNLAKLLNIEEGDDSHDKQKLILCKNNGAKLAFAVDEIHHLSEESDVINEDDEEFSEVSTISVFRVARLDSLNKTYTILDLELLINALERNYL